MQHDPSTDLMECLLWNHEHPTVESIRQHALEIIRSGGNIHSVTEYKQTCLHRAMGNKLFDVVQVLLEKGIDVNAQNGRGNTALHEVYFSLWQNKVRNIQTLTELVPMLLYHGADPWIRNSSSYTPLDLIMIYRFEPNLRDSDVKKKLVPIIEHLYYHMFDKYTEFRISVYTLLITAYVQPSVFQEIVKTVKEVDLDDLEMPPCRNIDLILSMPSENLRLLLDKFDYVFKALFRWRNVYYYYSRLSKMFRFENIYILVGSPLQREFINWLCEWQTSYKFIEYLFKKRAPLASREEIVYYLLSYGMDIDERDIEIVYKYCGYNQLFKFLRFVDVKCYSCDLTEIVPRLVFDVTGDIQKSIEDPQFWVKHITDKYSKLDFEPVLAYYVVPNLKDLCCEVKVEGKDNFFKKLLEQPRIPLLVEMARNVFRKYFVQILGITSGKQFYESLKLLPISSIHRKIISLETGLYS